MVTELFQCVSKRLLGLKLGYAVLTSGKLLSSHSDAAKSGASAYAAGWSALVV